MLEGETGEQNQAGGRGLRPAEGGMVPDEVRVDGDRAVWVRSRLGKTSQVYSTPMQHLAQLIGPSSWEPISPQLLRQDPLLFTSTSADCSSPASWSCSVQEWPTNTYLLPLPLCPPSCLLDIADGMSSVHLRGIPSKTKLLISTPNPSSPQTSHPG